MTPSRRAPAKAAASVGRRADKAPPARAMAKKAAKEPAPTQRPAGEAPPAKSTPAPGKATPGQQTPAKATPAKATPAKSAPAKATPAKATPAPGKATPGQQTPAKSAPAKATPAKGSPTTGPGASTGRAEGHPATAGARHPERQPSTHPAPPPTTAASPDGSPRRPSRALGAPRQSPVEGRAPGAGPYADDTKFLQEQRNRLLEERAVYQRQADDLRAEADALALEREPGDVQFDEESGEGGTIAVDRERDLTLSAQALAAIDEIDLALREIDAGTYGACERCGKPISKERLRALPYARLDVACKSGGLHRR